MEEDGGDTAKTDEVKPKESEPVAAESTGLPLGRMSTMQRTPVFNMMPQAQKPVLRYMPTYRLEPRFPLNREKCENEMKAVMEQTFETFVYAPKYSLNLCAQVSEEIKNRIKTYNFDRYRYVCVVTIGEKVMQGFCSLVNFLWDAERDGYISYVYETPNFFAIATLYYLYYD